MSTKYSTKRMPGDFVAYVENGFKPPKIQKTEHYSMPQTAEEWEQYNDPSEVKKRADELDFQIRKLNRGHAMAEVWKKSKNKQKEMKEKKKRRNENYFWLSFCFVGCES